jgi:hypothetical protein
MVLWITIAAMEITPRRYKGMDHPPMYPSEAFATFGPPILAAAFLTVVRRFGGPTSRETTVKT